MDIKRIISCIVTSTAMCALSVHAEPFVFQGQLNDAGFPATGLYDLEFVLYGVDIGGAQIGPTVTLEDQDVSQGNFLVELDFGDVFDGATRWIEVSVRQGDLIDAYTELAPRVKIGKTPQASYASKAGVAESLENPVWNEAPGVLTYGGGTDRVFINRGVAVAPNDIFVVQASMNALAGMNIATYSGGMPYYGYAPGGWMQAYTYMDPITNAWIVNKNGGDQLEVDNNNDVIVTNNLIVGGTITSLSEPEVDIRYKSFTPDTIFSGFGYDRTFHFFAGAVMPQNSNSYLRANLELPHGATITNIRVEYVDQTSPDLRLELWKRNMLTIGYTSEVLGSSSGMIGNTVQAMSITPSPAIVIDNTAFTYSLRAQSSTGVWPNAGQMGIRNILVVYTMP